MLKAQIHWKDKPGVAIECEFSYPLKVGDTFIVADEAERYICTVDTIVHFPVNEDSGNTPSVGYFVSRKPASESYWKKQFWGDLLKNVLKLK
jgi:hypothetical protein